MNNLELVAEVEKLNRSHRIKNWVNLILGILIIFLAFYLIEIKYDYDGLFRFLLDIELHSILIGIGGGVIGLAWRNWNGNKELNLLNKLTNDN